MTRKDYIKLAQIIKDSSCVYEKEGYRSVLVLKTNDLRNFMHRLCRMLENDNPNFDERKFREAAGEILGQ